VSSAARTGAARSPRIGRVAAIVLVFVLLGPLLGSAVFSVATAMFGFGWNVGAYDALFITLFTWLFGAPMAYAVGFLPAVAAGLVIGIRQCFFGRASLLFAIATGLVVGALFLCVRWLLDVPDKTYAPTFVPIGLATCLLPTIVCWAIVRRWYDVPGRGMR
jgi:hypothetical protein